MSKNDQNNGTINTSANNRKTAPKIGDVSKVQVKPRKKHYVNNEDFYNALKQYKVLCNEVERVWNKTNKATFNKLIAEGCSKKEALSKLPKIPYPRVPEYIGVCIFKIATKLANSPNFCNYTYRDDMIADGYEDCILRIRSFDPDKSTNPFSYFTQACYFASLRRIKKEKKQKEIKSEIVKNSGILSEMSSDHIDGDDTQYGNSYLHFLLETVDSSHEAQKQNQETRQILKKTTKAHQARIKQREEDALKDLEQIIGETSADDDTSDDSPSLFSEDIPDTIKDYYLTDDESN